MWEKPSHNLLQLSTNKYGRNVITKFNLKAQFS